METSENYTLLIAKINVFIRKYYLNSLLRGLIFLGAGLFSAYVVITLCEYFGNFNSFFRGVLFYGFIILNLWLIAWLVAPPLLARLKLGRSLTHDQAAEIIGKHFSDVNDKLLNTLQLKKLSAEALQHRELIEASIDQKIAALQPVRFPSAINIKDNTRYLKWILAPAGVIIIIAFAAPSILTESTKRIIRHGEYFAPVAPFKFVVLNHDLSVVQGEDLKLDLKLEGNGLPADVYVETANNTFKLDKENITRFHYLFTNLQQSTSFRLVGNGFNSAPYQIKVNLRPSLLHFDVELNYPAYLNKKNDVLPNAGDLTVPVGTSITWKFHTQNATRLMFLMNDEHSPLNLVSNDLFEHSEKIYKASVYTLNPINSVVTHTDSAAYRINVIADELPNIQVQEKPDSVSLNALYFNGAIQDDHGFSSLNFHYTVTPPGDKGNGKSFVRPVKADLGQPQADFFYFWNMKELGIKPGEKVTYFFEVADNDGVNGAKRVRTPERSLSVPEAGELNDQLNSGTEAVKQKMQDAVKLAAQLERDAQKLNQLLLNKNNLSFDEKKQLEDLLQKKKDLDELVKQIQDENKKNLYNRRENQAQSKELTEEQKQIEKLLDQMLDPKTREMLQKLQDMVQKAQKEDTRQELSKMQMDNKSFKKELERMLELYKKMEFDQKMNQSINQLKQLADKQEKLAEQTKQSDADQKKQSDADQKKQSDADQKKQSDAEQKKLQQEQQKLKDAFDELKKQLDDLKKSNPKEAEKQEMDENEKDQKDIDQKMEESSEQLAKNNKQKASQSQQQSSKQMKQLAQKMEEKQEQDQEEQAQINMKQLRELLKSLVNSSFEQEKVMKNLMNISTADPGYVSLAQSQKNIKDNLKTTEDSLYSLSTRFPPLQSTVNREISAINSRIDDALQNLGDRRTAEASRNQQYAMTSINNLALMLDDALQNMQMQMQQKKSGKSGKQQQKSLSQLKEQQQRLNQNMQRMRDQMQQQPEKNMSQSQRSQMSEQLARMAREQQEIRQALERISTDEGKNGNNIKNADKISQQMEQTEKDLVNRKITDEALKRQQEIQTRLLEAEKAQREQEQDKKREAHAGNDMPPGYIKALQEYQQAKTKQTEQIRTVPPALSIYYKQKIKSYFDQLNAK